MNDVRSLYSSWPTTLPRGMIALMHSSSSNEQLQFEKSSKYGLLYRNSQIERATSPYPSRPVLAMKSDRGYCVHENHTPRGVPAADTGTRSIMLISHIEPQPQIRFSIVKWVACVVIEDSAPSLSALWALKACAAPAFTLIAPYARAILQGSHHALAS